VLPSYPVLAVLLAASAAWQGDWWSLARAVIGAAALFAFFLAIVLIHPPGMGFGDVRLSGLIGGVLAYLSWSTCGHRRVRRLPARLRHRADPDRGPGRRPQGRRPLWTVHDRWCVTRRLRRPNR
jgi:hypothetical protein